MSQSPSSASVAVAPIAPKELARRFGISLPEARAWLSEMPHVRRGRLRWTTEAWLAAYLATKVKRPVMPKARDPLEEVLVRRVAQTVESLVNSGMIKVAGKPKPA